MSIGPLQTTRRTISGLTTSAWTQRDWYLFGGLLLVGVAVRWLLFDHVGVWGDFGFYTYDAGLILQGQTPFIDFLGRSPIFLYSYAAVADLTGEFVRTLRWFAIGWYLVTALPVYLIGRRLRDRRVATVALIFFLLTPFSLAYGVRASTQSMALAFSVWGIYALVRDERALGVAVCGAGIGLGFLARQSMIAVLGGVGLWLVIQAYRDGWTLRQTVGRLTALATAFVGVVFAGYVAVMGGSLSQAIALFDQQVVGLFLTSGRGGLPLIGVEFPAVHTQPPTGALPIVNHICPQCSSRTARVFASTIMAGAPVVAVFTWYLRDWTDRWFDERLWVYFAGVMVALGIYAVGQTLWAGHLWRGVTICALLALSVVVWRVPPLPRQYLYGRLPALLVAVCGGLAAGYLVRDRMVANYYFLDFWPFVSLLAALLLVAGLEWVDRPQRTAVVALVGVLMLSSLFAAHPLASSVIADDDDSQFFSVSLIERYGEDIDARTDPGDPVFSGHPTYLAASAARMPMDDPRVHYRYSTFATKDGPQWPAADMFEHIERGLADGSLEVVVLDTMTSRMIQYQGILTDEFMTNYCRVAPADSLYAETGSQLYEYRPDCPSHLQPNAAIIETIATAEYEYDDE